MRKRALPAAVCAAALLTSACGGGGDAETGKGGTGERLTAAFQAAPPTLDPAKIDQAFGSFLSPGYDPLIRRAADGTLQPGLALSWKYLGSDNKTFTLALRPDVKFADGEKLTAEGVVKHLEYVQKAGGSSALLLTGAVFKADDANTVRITFATPNPVAPDILSQNMVVGDVISPKALAQPETLATSTAGAGPYTLDPKDTVAGDHYTYVPNPNYWNKEGVRYKRVVLRVIANPNTAVNALKTGQIDVASADSSVASSAKSAGLKITQIPFVIQGLALFDRDGSLLKPLGDVRVRQAINHAIDRKAVSRALLGEYGVPTGQFTIPGGEGDVPENRDALPYDPEKAKKLLAEAGYPGGFTLPVVSTPFAGLGTLAQALADQLGKVGIKVELRTSANANSYLKDMSSGSAPAAVIGYGHQPAFLEGLSLFLPTASVFNPRKSASPQLTSLFGKLSTASQENRPAAAQAVHDWLVDNAWFAPVAISPVFYFSRPTVGGVQVTPGNPIANPADWYPAR